MLLETIHYTNELPVSIRFSNVKEEHLHYHKETEILFALRGTANCKIHHLDYPLSAGDVLIVDSEDLHQIYDCSADILFIIMHIDLEHFCDLYPNVDFMIFVCEESDRITGEKYQEYQNKVAFFKRHLAKLMLLFIESPKELSTLMAEIDEFVFMLVNQFQGFFIENNQFNSDCGDNNAVDLQRLYRIIKFLYLNYDQKITLDDIANLEHLSPYYISHLIKNVSGLSFQQLLNLFRLEHAERYLASGKMTLTQISGFCGFSTPAYFNKCFKSVYKITPSQYRKQLRHPARSYGNPFSTEEAIPLLEPYVDAYKSRKALAAYDHIFIPVKKTYKCCKPLEEVYPLTIYISSQYELIEFCHFMHEPGLLTPDALLIKDAIFEQSSSPQELRTLLHPLCFLNCPIKLALSNDKKRDALESVCKGLGLEVTFIAMAAVKLPPDLPTSSAAALANVLHRDSPVSLHFSGRFNALFYNALKTPYFYLYAFLAKTKGALVELRQQYFMIRNASALFIVIFQDAADPMLHGYIHMDNIDSYRLIIKQTFSKTDNCFSILEKIKNPPILGDTLIDQINQLSAGRLEIEPFEQMPPLDIHIDVAPGSLAIIEIHH